MHFTLRPSKSFSFDILEAELARLPKKVGLDAGSAHLRNRALFHTSIYYGLDLRKDHIAEGLTKFQGDDTLGIHADLRNLKALPSNSVDVVVSTNTLYHLPREFILGSINELVRILHPNGTIIVELPLDEDFDTRKSVFVKELKDIRIVFYKNKISRAYERFFERDGFLGSHPVAGTKPFLLLSWIISRVEFLTCHSRSFNTHALIIGSNKKEEGDPQSFDLSHIPLSERIYDLVS